MLELPPMLSLPRAGRYRVGLVDFPWHYETWTAAGAGRSPQRHYPTMTVAEGLALPIGGLMARDAVLFHWVVQEQLPAALALLEAWGFRYRTLAFVWEKTNANGSPRLGLGHHTRKDVELCLLGTRGAGYRRADRGVPQLIKAPVREHSRKPDEVYGRIERLVGRGPAVELFSRTDRRGWDRWGFEVGKFGGA